MSPQYPPTLARAHASGEATHEAVVDREGKLLELRLVGTTFFALAPSAEAAIRRTQFRGARLEGNPVGARFRITTPFGPPSGRAPAAAQSRVWVFVPSGEGRNARWQLAGRVRRVTVAAQLAVATRESARVVAVDPAGGEHELAALAAPGPPRDLRSTVRVGKAFEAPGEYRIDLVADGVRVAQTGFTVAADWKTAVVNACEP